MRECLSLFRLRNLFKEHQRRLAAGDKLQSITEIAQRAGIHRDTIYALLSGERISPRSQYALSRVISELQEEINHITKTRIMSISFDAAGPRIKFGIHGNALLK